MYLDEKTKKRAPHPYVEDKESVIYFKCNGIKVGAALDLNKTLDGAISEYMARSDFQSLTGNDKGSYDYDREKSLCGYRRTICIAEVAYADTSYGKKHTYKFSVVKEATPDGKSERVKILTPDYTKNILDLCKSTQKDFAKQFDKSGNMNRSSYAKEDKVSAPQVAANPTFEDMTSSAGDDLSLSLNQELQSPKKEEKIKPSAPKVSVVSEPVASSKDVDAFDLDLNL